MVDQIRRIGEDPALIRETVAQVRRAKQERLPALRAEQKRLQRGLEAARAEVKGLILAIGQGAADVAAGQLDELQQKAERLEARLQELEAEIAAAAEATVDQADVTRALSLFDPIWEVLYPLEQERIVQLLIERIDYEATGKKLGIEFKATGIRSLAAEVATTEEATA